MSPVVFAVIVNHNTSLFAELAVRSLAATHVAVPDACDLHIVVRDNHSEDREVGRLRDASAACGAAFEQTAWPVGAAAVNTHGDVLRDFVLEHPEAHHYLFVDADIDFDRPGIVALLVEDLLADDHLWAVQARFADLERHEGSGSSLDIWSGRPVDVGLSVSLGSPSEPRSIAAHIRPRLHPGCALVRNSDDLQRVVRTLGFGVAVVESADPEMAGLFDTMGLASAAMSLVGWRYGLSRAAVHHFFNVSFDAQDLDRKRRDARARLDRFA